MAGPGFVTRGVDVWAVSGVRCGVSGGPDACGADRDGMVEGVGIAAVAIGVDRLGRGSVQSAGRMRLVWSGTVCRRCAIAW